MMQYDIDDTDLNPPTDGGPARPKGLFVKFRVSRMDHRPKKANAAYFVLDVQNDPFARAALLAYADSCQGAKPELARDIYEHFRDREPNWDVLRGDEDPRDL